MATGGSAGAPGGTGGVSVGGTGGTGPVPTECEYHAPTIGACVLTSAGKTPLDWNNPVETKVSGQITEVGFPSMQEATDCFDWDNGGRMPAHVDPANATWFRVADGSGTALVGIAVPGFDESRLSVGSDVELSTHMESGGWGEGIGYLELNDSTGLIATVGSNDHGPLQITQGPEICYSEGDLCGRSHYDMHVQVGTESASLSPGESKRVGDLMVTNDKYLQNYDTSGGCNFGVSVESLVGAARP